jgi:secreted trypsin-like serine protease
LQLIQKQPTSDENRQFLQKSQCGFYNRKPYVCCASETSLDNSAKLSLLPALDECGSNRESIYVNRVVGGERTKIDEFPWLARVRYQDQKTKELSFRCGGSLINKQYVLTAGHCVKETNRIPIRFKP